MFAAAASIFWLHLSLQPVLSGSMRPTYAPGALLVTKPMPTSKVRPGDIVVIIPPGETAPFAHRVATVTSSDGRTVITTKGDANPAADKWHAALLGSTVPQVITSVPYLGRAAVAMHGPMLRVLIAAFAGIAVAVAATRRLLPHHPTPSPA